MNPPSKTLRVIGYVRVSTAEQADSGAGLDAQREALERAAKQRGWELVEVIADEGLSGGKSHEKRPGLCAALGRVEAGDADALAVAKLDRLSRSIGDLVQMVERARRKSWSLILLDVDVDTSTPTGALLVNMMGSVAEWERRIIGQRTKDALAIKRAQGVRLGRPSTLDAELVGRIVREHRDGASYSAIARTLTAEGIPTAQGGSWWPATVRKVLHGQDAQKVAAS